MTSVITGDIVNSRSGGESREWLDRLKLELNRIGKSPKTWEIFRGDSFQVEVKDISETLLVALKVKAAMKCIPKMDARMAIGIGTKTTESQKITQAQGEAFIRSGNLFEEIKKNRLAIRSPWQEWDVYINLCLELALLTMDRWTPPSAEIVRISLEMTDATQAEIANTLGITQGRVSDRQRRAGYAEVMKMERQYRKWITDKMAIP